MLSSIFFCGQKLLFILNNEIKEQLVTLLWRDIWNKNDNIQKNEVQQIRWSDEYWQYRVAANITDYQNNHPKSMEKKQLFYVKMSKINKFKWTYWLFGHNYRVAALSTFYLTVIGIIIPRLKSVGQFWIN